MLNGLPRFGGCLASRVTLRLLTACLVFFAACAENRLHTYMVVQSPPAGRGKFLAMDGEDLFYGAAYKGSKQFTQQQVKTANATGFGAAADDYMERGIDLNEQLIRNKPATFFFRMKGDAMKEAGIFDGDILIVDRSVKLVNGKVIVAILNGELLVRRFHKNFSSAFLGSDRFTPPIIASICAASASLPAGLASGLSSPPSFFSSSCDGETKWISPL